MNNRFLLDSWALLAWLYAEKPAADRIQELINAASIGHVQLSLSVINFGEVYYIFGRERGVDAGKKLVSGLKQLPIQILPVDEQRVLAAAQYKMAHPISYADAFAIAAAIELNAALLTGDPELFALDGEIKIERLSRSSQTKS